MVNNEAEVSIHERIKEGSDTLIVSFGGNAKFIGMIPPFEFLNFLEAKFPDPSKIFIIDLNQNSYNNGIKGITTNVDETIEFLREKIRGYKYVYFIGVSAGGYASIMFGSLLEITGVIAFIPQTTRNEIKLNKYVDPKYSDLKPYISTNTSTQYYLFADTSIKNSDDVHHQSHCTRLNMFLNVRIKMLPNFNLPSMRDNGKLHAIINEIMNKNKNN